MATCAVALAAIAGCGNSPAPKPQEPTAAAEAILARLPAAGPAEPDALALVARANTELSTRNPDRGTVAKAQLERLWRLRQPGPRDEASWGLTFAYDDFADGSVNPASTRYTYTTAVAALAYLDAYDRFGRQRDLRRAQAAANAIMRRMCCLRRAGAQAVWYSDQRADQRPGLVVYNVNGLTLEVLDRLAAFEPGARARERAAIGAFVRAGQGVGLDTTPQSGTRIARTNWRYAAGRPQPNDLLHETFIVDGLLTASDPRDRRAARRSLDGIWSTHLGGRGVPRGGVYTQGTKGWGPPAALLAYTQAGSRTRSDALGRALLARVASDGRISGVSDPRATPWYALALARWGR